MATSTNLKNLCDTCGKAKGIFKCEGCSKIFCFNHFEDHRQQLNTQLDEVEVNRDIFRQTLTEQTTDSLHHSLIQQINNWEHRSIEKIRKAANEARDIVVKHPSNHISDLEVKLNELTDQLRESRHGNDFVETDIHHWNEQLTQLTKELTHPLGLTLEEQSQPLVMKISVKLSDVPLPLTIMNVNTLWKSDGVTVAGGYGAGDGAGELRYPWGFCIEDGSQNMYVADTGNHRIVEVRYYKDSGYRMSRRLEKDCLPKFNRPSDIIFDKTTSSLIISDTGNRQIVRCPLTVYDRIKIIIPNVSCHGLALGYDLCLYIADSDKHEVTRRKIGDTSGTIVAGGNGKGSRLDQLNNPMYIFVDRDYSVYVSDEGNHRVMKWVQNAKEGIVVAGGHGQGNSLSQLSRPRGVLLDQSGNVYVADMDNNRIMCWKQGATHGSIIAGGNGPGNQADQFDSPVGMSFDQRGNLYVADLCNHRIQRFDIN